MPEADHAHVRSQVVQHLSDVDARVGPRERVVVATPLAINDGKRDRAITRAERLAFVLAAVGWGKRSGRKLEVVRVLAGGQVGLVFGAREASGG